MEKHIKIVAESLQEWEYSSYSNELNEGFFGDFIDKIKYLLKSKKEKWESLDKNNEKAVRAFANDAILKRVSGKTLKILNDKISNAPFEELKKEIEKAFKDDFRGNWAWSTPEYKPKPKVRLQSATYSGHSASNL